MSKLGQEVLVCQYEIIRANMAIQQNFMEIPVGF